MSMSSIKIIAYISTIFDRDVDGITEYMDDVASKINNGNENAEDEIEHDFYSWFRNKRNQIELSNRQLAEMIANFSEFNESMMFKLLKDIKNGIWAFPVPGMFMTVKDQHVELRMLPSMRAAPALNENYEATDCICLDIKMGNKGYTVNHFIIHDLQKNCMKSTISDDKDLVMKCFYSWMILMKLDCNELFDMKGLL